MMYVFLNLIMRNMYTKVLSIRPFKSPRYTTMRA